jgi:predicted pyridoxine 5'-phosphate oxidase superfamily flavin-nucleotide-binding protein
VPQQAAKVGGSIHNAVPPAAGAFLEQRGFVVLATADPDGRPWASVLTGPPGFTSAPHPLEVRIRASPVPGDPLGENVETSRFAGLLAIDLATRRRMRVNGALERGPDGEIVIHVEQVYSNCPKYIQRRTVEREEPVGTARLVRHTGLLSEEQRAWLRRADTFFIATLNPEEGADASHRGGLPGFIEVEGDRLIWPDYAGNMMYNTLGNIALYSRAGLLAPDFSSGSVLQLTGRAGILWSGGDVPGAERRVELEVEDVVEIAGVLPPAEAVEYSPFNPRQT